MLYEQMVREARQAGTTQLRRKDGSILTFRYWAQETKTAGMTFWVSLGYVEAAASPRAEGAPEAAPIPSA